MRTAMEGRASRVLQRGTLRDQPQDHHQRAPLIATATIRANDIQRHLPRCLQTTAASMQDRKWKDDSNTTLRGFCSC